MEIYTKRQIDDSAGRPDMNPEIYGFKLRTLLMIAMVAYALGIAIPEYNLLRLMFAICALALFGCEMHMLTKEKYAPKNL